MKNKDIFKMELHEVIYLDSIEHTEDGTITHQDAIKILKVDGGWIYNDKIFVPIQFINIIT